MPWFPVPLVGPSAKARAIGQNPERTVNLYAEQGIGNAKVPVSLLGTPGNAQFALLSYVARGWHVMSGRLFVVSGPDVLEMYADGTTYAWGALTTTTGYVGFSDNNGKLTLGDGTGFFLLDPALGTIVETRVEGTDPIPGYHSATIDQTTLLLERDTQKVWYSDVNDPGTVTGLSFFSAEALSDDANSLIVDRQEIYVGGPDSIQPFYDSGDADNPYRPIGSGLIKKGVSAPLTFVPFDSGQVFVGLDSIAGGYVVWQQSGPGAEPQRISDHAVEKALSEVTDISVLTACVYGEEGHLFYALHLATTQVWDANTKLWHERAWLNPATGAQQRQRGNFHAWCFGKHLFSDWESGRILNQSLSLHSDNGSPMVALREFAVDTQGQWARFDALELEFKVGVGLDGTGQGTDPQVMAQYSDDGGRSWSNEMWEPLGKIGETQARVLFSRLGSSNNRAYRVSVSDPVERQFLRARSNHTPLRR